MILVTVGTSSPPFNRLLNEVGNIFNKIGDSVVIQCGKTEFKHDQIRVFDFIDEDRFLSMINDARIIVTHGGFGILATLINMKKKIVAVPREECYGEATNPQIELVQYLDMNGALIGVYNIMDLHAAIQKAEKFEPNYKFENSQIPHIVKCLIDGYRGLNGG